MAYVKVMKHPEKIVVAAVILLAASDASADWRIETVPAGAQVVYDGRNLGPSPISVPSRHGHTFSAILPGYAIQSIESRGPFNNRMITIRLKPDGSAPFRTTPGSLAPSPFGERDR